MCISLVVSHIAEAAVEEFLPGRMMATTTVYMPRSNPIHPSDGTFAVSCSTRDDPDIQMFLQMPNYSLKNTNDGSCHYAHVIVGLDTQPSVYQLWTRPKGKNTDQTFVSTRDPQSSCPGSLVPLISTDLFFYQLLSTNYMKVVIGDYNRASEQFTYGPAMLFNLIKMRDDLIELYNLCLKRE